MHDNLMLISKLYILYGGPTLLKRFSELNDEKIGPKLYVTS